MTNSKNKQVITTSYVNGITHLEDGIILFERDHDWKPPTELIDVFSSCWSVTFGDFREGDLGFFRKGKTLPFKGPHCFLIPPFSTVHWKIFAKKLKWKSFIFISQPNCHFPETARAFKISMIPNLSDRAHLERFVCLMTSTNLGQQIDNINKETHVAVLAREYINKHFMKDFSIKEMAEELSYSHSVMSRYFRNCYSMTAIQYRNQLRLFDSLLTLLHSQKPVYKVAEASGNQDISRYYRKFRNFFGTSPSAYQIEEGNNVDSINEVTA